MLPNFGIYPSSALSQADPDLQIWETFIKISFWIPGQGFVFPQTLSVYHNLQAACYYYTTHYLYIQTADCCYIISLYFHRGWYYYLTHYLYI